MLKPRSTSTRELVRLDGLWRFALDTAVGQTPWVGLLDTGREAPVPAATTLGCRLDRCDATTGPRRDPRLSSP